MAIHFLFDLPIRTLEVTIISVVHFSEIFKDKDASQGHSTVQK